MQNFTDNDVISITQANFTKANNESTEKLIPIKKKLKHPKLSNDHRST